MITPEEDFETWKLIITTVTDDVSSFSSLFPDLQRLLRSIEQSGSLPDDLASQTDDFVSIISPSIVNPLLNLSALDDVDVLILIETFQAIIECCTSQIANKNVKYVEIIEEMLTQDQKQLYRSNSTFEVRETLINFFISIDGYQKCIAAIDNENENANKVGILFNISLTCIPFLENLDSNEPSNQEEDKKSDLMNISDKTADALCRVCGKDIRSFPVSVIDKIFSKIEFNSKWLSLFLILLKSDFFDKKLFSLQKLVKIIENENNKGIMIDFLKNNLDEIISIPIHSEFGTHLGSIYGFAASNSLLNIEHIKNIWKNEEFIHPTVLQSFYSIFEILSYKLPETESIEYANTIVNSKNEFSQIWLHLISTVAQNFMKNKYKDAFEILRNKIWSFAFPTPIENSKVIENSEGTENSKVNENSEGTENSKQNENHIEKNAKKILNDLCKFDCQILINKILSSFNEIDDSCLELIQKAASTEEHIENGKELLDIAIGKLPKEEAVNLISTLCITQKVELTPEQKDLIVHNKDKEKYLQKIDL